jgi:hypothetical protein
MVVIYCDTHHRGHVVGHVLDARDRGRSYRSRRRNRHRNTFGVQESLEQQVVLQGIEIRDAGHRHDEIRADRRRGPPAPVVLQRMKSATMK